MERLLSEFETSVFLGVSQATLQAWRFYRKGPPFCKLGRRVVYKPVDLESYLGQNRIDPGKREGNPEAER